MYQKRILPILLMSFLSFVMVSTVMAGEFDLNMKMKKLDGENGSLQEHVGKGKWTLVMFWETTCSICKQQEPEYAKFHADHKDKDAEVVAISIDGMDQVDLIKNYKQQNSLPYPVMVTDKPEIREKFLAATDEQFRGTPTYLLFSPEGELKAAQPGMLPATSVEKYIAAQSE
ncbi:MAG: TlpA family protein disulfide reductase [Gammaproteobacteria bacterium]